MKNTHGTRTTYNRGCRCEECRTANSTYMSQYYHDHIRHPSQRSRRAWEPWEDDQASDYTKSARQIAQILGRTTSAVINRRRALLARKNNQ